MEELTNPHRAVGNGQHLALAGVVLAAALGCIHLYDETPVPAPLRAPQELTAIPVAADGRCFWSSLFLHQAPFEVKSEWLAIARNPSGFPIDSSRLQWEARCC